MHMQRSHQARKHRTQHDKTEEGRWDAGPIPAENPSKPSRRKTVRLGLGLDGKAEVFIVNKRVGEESPVGSAMNLIHPADASGPGAGPSPFKRDAADAGAPGTRSAGDGSVRAPRESSGESSSDITEEDDDIASAVKATLRSLNEYEHEHAPGRGDEKAGATRGWNAELASRQKSRNLDDVLSASDRETMLRCVLYIGSHTTPSAW